MKRKITALFCLLTALCLTFTAAALADDTKITVTGNGEILVSADTAVIDLGISVRDTDVLKGQQRANEVIAAIRESLEKAGVAKEDLNTGFLNIYAVYDYSEGTEKLAGYNINSTLAIRARNMDQVGQLIDLALEAGANNLNGIRFSASDTEAARAEALKAALKDARTKAEVLAEAAGLKITGIEAINENGTYSYDSGMNNIMTAKGAAMEDAATVVQAAKLTVSAGVTVEFEAK